MKTFAHQVFEAYTNSDLNEGRGAHVTIGYFTYEDDARQAAKGQGVMGSDGGVQPKAIVVRIFESFSEYAQQCLEKDRERGLSKLSSAEKRALGLVE